MNIAPEISLPLALPAIIARFISDAANPFFIPSLMIALIGWLLPIPWVLLCTFLSISCLFYTVIPISSAFLLLRQKRITSLDLPKRTARGLLFKISIVSAAAGSLLLGIFSRHHYPIISAIALVFMINPLWGYVFNLKWKISMHATSVATGGTILFVLWTKAVPDAGLLCLGMLLLMLPLVLWARYRLHIHNIPELAGGLSAGILLTLVEISLMLNLW